MMYVIQNTFQAQKVTEDEEPINSLVNSTFQLSEESLMDVNCNGHR